MKIIKIWQCEQGKKDLTALMLGEYMCWHLSQADEQSMIYD